MARKFEMGNNLRRMGETKKNATSSRSHAIFRITLESYDASDQHNNKKSVKTSHLCFVDLAGSEKLDTTNSTRFNEGKNINKSLLTLRKVIQQLSANTEPKHVSYRDSKLTRILEQSLGGNASSVVICTVSIAALEETNSTLRWEIQ